jgi:hypothetical protein
MIEKYLISSDVHAITRELEESKKSGIRGMEWFEDGTHKIYKFPNGIHASLIHFPKQESMFGWKYEIMTNEDEMFRALYQHEVDVILQDLFNRTKAP